MKKFNFKLLSFYRSKIHIQIVENLFFALLIVIYECGYAKLCVL